MLCSAVVTIVTQKNSTADIMTQHVWNKCLLWMFAQSRLRMAIKRDHAFREHATYGVFDVTIHDWMEDRPEVRVHLYKYTDFRKKI